MKIFGTDYTTPDGKCIRDFIHTADLSELYFLALDYLLDEGNSDIFNYRYGHGFSAREVIETAKKSPGKNFKIEGSERRPVLIASNKQVKNIIS